MFEMKQIWVIGGGRFGQKAGLALKKKFPDQDIVCVEKDQRNCIKLSHIFDQVFCMDGIRFLKNHLKISNTPEWIIPAIPVHIAFNWIRRNLSFEFNVVPVDLPDNFLDHLPHPIKGAHHDVYASIADFVCPDNCPEPDNFCTMTKKKRPYHLFEEIYRQCPEDFLPVVIRSHQLVPGTGGILPIDLFGGLEKIRSSKRPVLLATACRCHGVISAFQCIKINL
jgi:hypothetical protein